MANIKFSQFTSQTDYNNVADLVGYNGAVNVRITPVDLVQGYLSTNPLSASTDGVFIGNLGSGTSSAVQIGKASNLNSSINLNHDTALSGSGIVSSNSELQLRLNSPTSRDVVNLTQSIGAIKTEFTELGDVNQSFCALTLQTNGTAGNTFEIRHNIGGDLILSNQVNTELLIGPNQDISIIPGGDITMQSTTGFGQDILDQNAFAGNAGYILESQGGGNNGVRWKVKQPGIQLKISGTAGLTNTNNGVDFQIPYNTVVVNDAATIFNPTVSGAGQGQIEVLETGRYEFFARYSSFDLFQTSLPTVDGTKFLRITATLNGVKQCVLQDLIVATSVNGEANVTGGGFMDFNAGDIFTITGFHTGATGGSGTQGFPVSSNAFFNEPMIWLVKIQ